MRLDAIGVASADMANTVNFYSLLGFSFPAFTKEDKHLEAVTKEGEVRFMIDDATFLESIIGQTPMAANHSTFALLCESPADVDTAVERIRENGYRVVKEPWNAVWGQRYAVIADPDGYMVDLFARFTD
ncbi:MAG: VOC family protein [Patescibacteria group bacterium]